MIIDIPSSKDFEQSGIEFLNLAWDGAFNLWHEWNNSGWRDIDPWGDEERDYWKTVQRSLSTSFALAQQGIEFLLKSRIASVSPFLLIASPNEWAASKDIAFADIRTIDAQDLVKVHDTVQSVTLSDDFKQRFGRMRRLRNSILHTVDKRIELSVRDILGVILESVVVLIPNDRWPNIRRNYLSNRYQFDDCTLSVNARELNFVIDSFEPAFLYRTLSFNKRQRRYICVSCRSEMPDFWSTNEEPLTAQLRPNTPHSTSLYCIACDKTINVRRKPCQEVDCNGNVIEIEDNNCCTCGNEN